MLTCRPTFSFALFCLLCALSYPAGAQETETRVIPLAVVATDGNAVTGLQPQNIRLHNRGVLLKSLRVDTTPRRVVLLFDTSGSMAISNGRVTLLQAAVHTAGLLLAQLPRADLISVHAFADKDKQLVDFTHDPEAIRAALNDLLIPHTEAAKKKYGTGTDLYNALNSIVSVLSGSPQFGDSIILFSDGMLPRSNSDNIMAFYDQPDYLERIAPRLATNGVRVFFSLAGDVEGAPPLHGVEMFIGATGGESFELNDSGPSFYGGVYDQPQAPVYRSNSLEQRARALCAAIQDTYRLQLQFASALKKPAELHINVVDKRDKTLRNVSVLSPKFVYPGIRTHP